ncbi:TPA: AlpA family transcriptional regulator [Vibrio vulnificus]|uniref:helix-turn-helix transcriptional regulator n=1 Tax=Vibrio TaxID=662 RepID=UPI0005F16DA6|nr:MULTISPECIES: hypothetical protein [Vibrio]HDY7458516.1 AlpA family transcriptional regulator [Vibrio vulnificus]ELA9876928.1 AlpA family transcriptional regulator [Vibrio parahaemolyticus]MDW3169879.1 AlpA family transcriptional regulator [Vibrio sp. Y184]MEA5383874.1 AlpA family transcriptional regulator [Vibrio parahaemolyticus]HCD5126193.1 AlpA family transcriptional regulator [Vibrio parahaemolyticus]
MNNTPKHHQQFDRIVSLDELSSILGRSKRTLWRWWAKDKTIPLPLKRNGRAVGYRLSTVEEIIKGLEG